MLKISVPEPCHEDWNAMTPNEQGRHCTSCAKTVVDFTSMSDEAIKHFFIIKKEEKVCGRFKNEQLHRIVIELPHNIFYIPMPGWKKFLVASLLVFSTTLFSCDITVKGKIDNTCDATTGLIIIPENKSLDDTASIGEPIALPATPAKPEIAGIIQMISCTPITQGTPVVVILNHPIEEMIKGDIEFLDTVVIEKPDTISIPENTNEIKILKPDSLKTKNPPKADSLNCDTQVYY